MVPLGVDRVRDLDRGVPEGQLGGLETEGPTDLSVVVCRSWSGFQRWAFCHAASEVL